VPKRVEGQIGGLALLGSFYSAENWHQKNLRSIWRSLRLFGWKRNFVKV